MTHLVECNLVKRSSIRSIMRYSDADGTKGLFSNNSSLEKVWIETKIIRE